MTSIHFTGVRTSTATACTSVLVKKNGDHSSTGVRVPFDQSDKFDEWLTTASKHLDLFPPAQKAFDAFGQEVGDVLLFQDGHAVYLAQQKTDKFLPINSGRAGGGGADDEGALPAQLGVFTVGKAIGRKSLLGTRLAAAENTSTGEKVCLKFIPMVRTLLIPKVCRWCTVCKAPYVI